MSEKSVLKAPQHPAYSVIEVLESVESTNTFAGELLTQDALKRRRLGELSLISTDDQTRGKGRLDRVWSAPAGTMLATSFIVRPHANSARRVPARSLHWVTLLLALAGVHTWQDLGVKTSIKWPNDVLANGKKCCGILATLVQEPEGRFSVVAGIGMNLNLEADDLPVPTATSALLETGQAVDPNFALQRLAAHFAKLYQDFATVNADPHAALSGGSSLLEQSVEAMGTIGQEVNIHLPGNKIETGVAVGLNADGEILIQQPSGTVTSYAVGDIVHLRPQ